MPQVQLASGPRAGAESVLCPVSAGADGGGVAMLLPRRLTTAVVRGNADL